jgi:hypothetical protein
MCKEKAPGQLDQGTICGIMPADFEINFDMKIQHR